MTFDAIVLAGGGARRLGGQDKAALLVGSRTMLDTVLEACRTAEVTVVVGPARPTQRPVSWAREDPVGTGPVPALRAGLQHVTSDTIVLLAADLPLLTSEFVTWLSEQAPAVLTADDREQWLCSAWPAQALRQAMPAPALKTFLGALPHAAMCWPGDDAPWLDCDTPADLLAARAHLRHIRSSTGEGSGPRAAS